MTAAQWRGLEDALAYGRDLLIGSRIRLRALREADLEPLESWWSDPEIAMLQHATLRPTPPGALRDQFRAWSANQTPGSAGFSVVRRDDDTFVGHITLYGAEPQNRAAMLAVIIGPEHTGQGYGTDAVRVMVGYGFKEMGLHRIGLEVFAYNERAIAAYAKVGFREEGRRRDAVFHDGRFHDQVLMSILEPEWPTA